MKTLHSFAHPPSFNGKTPFTAVWRSRGRDLGLLLEQRTREELEKMKGSQGNPVPCKLLKLGNVGNK